MYRRKKSDPQVWVFWVHASSAARFKQSYQQIAKQVQLNGWSDSQADVLGMVYTWLSDANHGQWTMVVDNADSTDVAFGLHKSKSQIIHGTSVSSEDKFSKSPSIADYLPSSPHGSIVITSRSREVVEGLIEYVDDIFEVNPMSEADAVALLTRKLKKSQSESDPIALSYLVRQLDYMPLAITQAAAYINQPGSRTSVAVYAEKLALGDADRNRLLTKDIRDPRRDGEASNSIMMTWHTSFEHIRQTRDSAARLLSLMSFFDREGIPEALLQGRYFCERIAADSQKEEVTDSRSINDFDEDIRVLCAYSLIKIGTTEKLFEMHRLVQYSTRKWLELHHEAVAWQEKYIDLVDEALLEETYVNWIKCRPLFPHVEQVLLYNVEDERYIQKRAEILNRAAWYALQDGQYELGKKMAETSLQDAEKISEEGSIGRAHCLRTLALVLVYQGEFDEAEGLNRRALATYEKELGSNGFDKLACLRDLAIVLTHQGKYDEAEKIYRQVFVGYEREFGSDNEDTLLALNNLALITQELGKYNEAESMFRQVLEKHKDVIGPHPKMPAILGNLARTLYHQGKYDEAEAIDRQVLEMYDERLGSNHPDTLFTLHHLAMVVFSQSKINEAEEILQRVLEGYGSVLSHDHPTMLIVLGGLAMMLHQQGKYDEAKEMNQRVIAAQEQKLGSNHHHTLISWLNLAAVLYDQGKFDEAEEITTRVLVGFENVLGPAHPRTLYSVVNLGVIRCDQKAFDEALQLYDRAMKGFSLSYGADHPNTKHCQRLRETLLLRMGRSASAKSRPRPQRRFSS